MVLQKRLDYGFNGYEVPHTPRAARSPRKSAFKKKSENHQISSFDLLAAVAGKLLFEGGNSSSSSNNASGNNEDQCAVKKEPLHGGDIMVGEETNCGHDNNAERSFFVSEILPKAHEMQSFDRSPSPHKDFHFGSTSGITSDSSEKFETQDLAYEETKIDNSDCYRSESNDKKSMLGGINFEAKSSRNVVAKDENYIGSGFRKPIPQNPSVCSDDMDLLGKENDNGENFSARYTTKSFRSTLRIGDRRIRKVLASKYCKVSPKPKDTTVTNSDLNLKPDDYYSKKHCHRSLRSERNYPIKKRRYFDGYKEPQSEETAKNEGLSGSPPKASAFLSSIACQKQPAFQSSRDSHVKLGIKSFRVPELFIEIPETATVGSLKRTVLEAVTTILGGGLRIGVLVHGKKVRDDNKMLLQTGISLDTLSDTLGFCLEPNPPQSTKPLSPEDSDFQRPCNVVPHTLTRCLPSPGKHAKTSNSVESDLDSKPSAPNRAKTIYSSRALIPVPPLHAQALTVVPPRKNKRSEVAQRRIRRPFSVAEVEALVQAVERLGTGRWRDVKLRAFDNAKHRTYVDLKDKWKTLVHTARISPQQRRGEPVPQELLDRVLTAHAYWSQQQGKYQLLEEPQRLETSLGL
ncbi:Telomere repeat-binding protein 5 [Cardamine amara subsp. amara]|uniref:Telomere repeat-binding protein 5 n=1 Tax=Cardamine amara subsp. amara TaxID=228776 RepID=A0ABD1A5Y6_CARAN